MAGRDLDDDEQAVVAALMVSGSPDAPVFEKLTLGQIAARAGLTEERSGRALAKFEELDMVHRGTNARTQEEFFTAVPPEVLCLGLPRP